MKLALESPTPLLQYIQPFADFDWILTHKYLEDEAYREWYKNSKKIKYIDNSVNELNEPCKIEDMKKVWEELGSEDFIIAPDFYGDGKKTIQAYIDCIKTFGLDKVVGVVQGKSPEEWFLCLSIYTDKYQGLPIAIPYDIGSDKDRNSPGLMALRRALLVSNIPDNINIHLLGFVAKEELWWYKDKPNIQSIDTGMPVLLGLQGKDILEDLDNKNTPTFVQMEDKSTPKLSKENWPAILRNIALLRKELS